MPFSIDLKDKRILRELDLNARQTNSMVAKKVGLSPEVVNYRIKKLEEENIITHYTLITDLSKLGIMQFKICIKTQNISPVILENKLIELKKFDETKWVGTLFGPFDVVISCEVKSIFEMDKLKNKILSIFENYIFETEISLLVEAQIYPRDYLVDSNRAMDSQRTIMENKKQIVIDPLDLSILKELAKDVRRNVLDIAKSLKLTSRVVAYRIKQLEKKKIIQGYKIAIDYSKLKINYAKLFIYLTNPEKNNLNKFISFLKSHSSCIIYVKVFGSWDLEPEFEFSNDWDLDILLNEIRTKFPDLIKRIDVVSVKKEFKYTYF